MRTVARAVRRVSAGAACVALASCYGCAAKVRPGVTPVELAPLPVAQFVAADVIAEVKDFAVTLGGDELGHGRRRRLHRRHVGPHFRGAAVTDRKRQTRGAGAETTNGPR